MGILLSTVYVKAQFVQTVVPNCGIGGKGSSYAVESENGYLSATYDWIYDPGNTTWLHGGTIMEMDEDLDHLSGMSFRKNTSASQPLYVVDVERLDNSGSDDGYVAVGYFKSDRNSCDVGSSNNYNSFSSYIVATNSLTTGIQIKDVQIDFDIAGLSGGTGGPYYGQTFATDVMYDGSDFVVTGYVVLPDGQGTDCSGVTVEVEADEEHRYLPFVAKYTCSFTAGSTTITKVYQELFWTEYSSEKESFIPTRILANPNNTNYTLMGRWWSSRSGSDYTDGVAAKMNIQPSLTSGAVVVSNVKPLNDYASIVTQVKVGYYDATLGKYGFMYVGNDLSTSQEKAFFRITDRSFIPEGDLTIEDPGSASVNAIDFDLAGCSETQVMILGSRNTGGGNQEAISLSGVITDESTYWDIEIIDNQGTCFDEDYTRRHPKMYEPRSIFNKTGGSLMWGYGPTGDGAKHTEIETGNNLQEACDVHNDIDLSVSTSPTNYSQYSTSLNVQSEDMSTTDNVFTYSTACTPFFYTIANPCLGCLPNPGNNNGQTSATSLDQTGSINSEKHPFHLFPNPADQNIVVESDNEISSIRVYDMSGKGQIIQEGVLSNLFNLDISTLVPGVYKIQVTGVGGQHTQTFVKK